MIQTWQQRCEEHPDHEGIVSEQMIRDRMQEEIGDLRKAAEMALEALESVYGKGKRCEAAIKALRQALAKPDEVLAEREWVGLTDDEIAKYWGDAFAGNTQYVQGFARIIEAKLKERNCG